MNDRLRAVMSRQGVGADVLAEECGVDPKTVERWIYSGRIPHRRHRWAAAGLLRADETYLWPDVAVASTDQPAQRELLALYPDRASVPRQIWLGLLTHAQEHIDVLVFSGTFFAQTMPRVAKMLTERAEAGVKIRLCFGAPDSPSVAIRDAEEGLRGNLGPKIRASLTYYRDLVPVPGCEVRLHGTTLYNSLFRYDDEIIVNPHAFGEPASLNPALHLRRVEGGTLFGHYTTSFERVWTTASTWDGGEV